MMAEPAPTPTTPHEHARALGALGLRVLPIKPGHKRPPMSSWQHAATDEADKIDNWYRGLYRDAGVGLALGPQPCGTYLFAIDIDTHDPAHNGWEALADLEQQHGALPTTWRSLTGAGGAHLIFAAPPGVTVRNQQASGNRIAAGIDVRGDGGQIVVAPTVHPDTQRTYEWEADHAPWECPVARAPRWLLELVREPDPTPAPGTTPPAPRDDALFEAHRADWDWTAELLNRGWTHCGDRGGDSYWARPGKDRREGHSAVLHTPDGPLVIFTTEIDPTWTQAATRTRDGSGWAFGPFGFYAATHHAGNRSEAARALAERYGMGDVDLGSLMTPSADVEVMGEDPDQRLRDMLIDWHEFANTDHSAAAWLWEPIIPAGRATAIFAKGGTGKSLVVLRMVVDLVRQGVSVLYLDYEMTPDDLDDRLTDMGVEDPREFDGVLHYAQLPPLDPLDTGEGGRDIRRLAQITDAQLVVIDTFARAVEGDENDADTVRRFYSMTGLHLKADGRAFVRVDHAGKDSAKGQRGSSAKNDDVDLVWELKRTEDGYRMVRGKCRMGWVPDGVNLERSDDPLVITVQDSWSPAPGSKELAAVLDELGVDENASQRKAAAAVRAAGHKCRNDILRDAQKYRRLRSVTYHFAGDLLVDKSVETVGRGAGRGASDDPLGAVRGALDPETEKPHVDELGRGAGRGGAHPAEVSGAQCATRRGAHAPTPDPPNPDFDPLSILDGF